MKTRNLIIILVAVLASVSQGQVYPFEIFSNNGSYNDSDQINLYVDVCSGGDSLVDFTFHNQSTVDSSVARIYFDTGVIFTSASITSGPGTFFHQPANPENLPNGNTLVPTFETSEEMSFAANPPPSKNGINPGEWLLITLGLDGGTTFEDVIDGFESGDTRIGIHIIDLPDGSSEGAVTSNPEPATIALFGIGALTIRRRKK